MMKTKNNALLYRIRYRLEYLLFCISFALIKQLPICCVYWFGNVAGIILWLVSWRGRRQIYKNLAIVYPKGTPFARRKFSRLVFTHFCLVFLEFFVAQRLVSKDNWRQFISGPGLDFLREECNRSRQAIFVTGHIGNFLLGGDVPPFLGYRVATVFRFPQNPLVGLQWQRFLSRSGQNVISHDNSSAAIKAALGDGEYPILVSDQHAGRHALKINFFGRRACTPAGAAALARQFQLPLYVGAMLRSGTFRFTFHMRKVEPIITDDRQADIEYLATEANRMLEEYIHEAPEQWFWMHRRWRKEFAGELPKADKL